MVEKYVKLDFSLADFTKKNEKNVFFAPQIKIHS